MKRRASFSDFKYINLWDEDEFEIAGLTQIAKKRLRSQNAPVCHNTICDCERKPERGRLKIRDGHHRRVHNACWRKTQQCRNWSSFNAVGTRWCVWWARWEHLLTLWTTVKREMMRAILPDSIHVAFDDPWTVGHKQRSKTRAADREGRTTTTPETWGGQGYRWRRFAKSGTSK